MHLSEETPVAIEPSAGITERGGGGDPPHWQLCTLGVIPRLGLQLTANTAAVLPPTMIRRGDVCQITLGPTRPLRPGEAIGFAVRWRAEAASAAGRLMTLHRGCVADVRTGEPWSEHVFSLEKVAGTTGSLMVHCTPGLSFWRKPRELLLYDLATSDEASMDLERARSFRSLRIRNERANFDAYYQHAAFQPSAAPPAPSDGASASGSRTVAEASPAIAQVPPAAISPRVVTALEYSHAELARKVELKPPLFGWRLKTQVKAFQDARKPGDRPKFRVLSLCSGAARIEADLVRDIAPDAMSLTLVDVNPNLLEVARRALAPWGGVETIVTDVNALDLRGERYDVVLCVSALHHVVELEHVIGEIAQSIAGTGEFWSIGETLGRNGGRMLPESYEVADTYFRGLDAKYRRNRITGAVDHGLPDLDYSIGCFEGIRAASIEPTLLRFLRPQEVSKHNCIVHKLFGPSYSDNFDMTLASDRALVDRAVDLDVALHRRGPYGVELHGVYSGCAPAR